MRPSTFILPAAMVSLLAAVSPVQAGATVAFGSTVGATNQTSTGNPLDGRFQFELGVFSPGFVPDAGNTAEWQKHWKPLPGGVATYRTEALGSPFPPELRLNSFSGSVSLTSNNNLFLTGMPVFLWGFDRREGAGKAEWILLGDPSWTCPDGQSLDPAASYDVASASLAVIGSVGETGAEMTTAAVALSPVPETLAAWHQRNFGSGMSSTDPEGGSAQGLQDPDGDSFPNLVEFFTGSDPLTTDKAGLSGPFPEAGSLVVRHRRNALAAGVQGLVEWSADLEHWSTGGLTAVETAADAASVMVETRLPIPASGAAFFRLKVEE